MRNAFVNGIIGEVENRDDLYVISGDAGLGVFDDFKVRYPERFLNLGAAEQNMIGHAAGLALAGFKVMVYNIIPFVLYRCFEQVRNDICYQDLPVILAGIGSGLTYSPQGMTHYSIEDIALARTMPNLTVISPIDPVEARLAARYALDAKEPVYVRLAKRGEPDLHSHGDFRIEEPQELRAGERVALLCHGSITEEVLAAQQILAERGMTPRVVSVPMLQPLCERALVERLAGIEVVFSIEEHYAEGGLGTILAEKFSAGGWGGKLVRLGIPRRFIHEICDNAGMRRHFGISAAAIAETVASAY